MTTGRVSIILVREDVEELKQYKEPITKRRKRLKVD